MRGLQCSLSIATIILAGSLAAPAAAQSLELSQPTARQLVAAPPGFNDSCRRYQWFCTNRATRTAPIGPRKGMSESVSAVEAPTTAHMSAG